MHKSSERSDNDCAWNEDAPTVVPCAIFGLLEPVDIFSAGSFCVPPVLSSDGKDMTMKDNSSQKQDKQYMVPMEITMEAARDFGIDPKDIIWFPLGIQKCRVYLVPASREVYLAYMRPIWTEVKRMIREGRCIVKGKSGRLIRCPENNRCEDCELFSKVSREQNKPMSLSVLLNEGTELTVESFEDDVIYSILFKELIAMLTEIKPKFGEIFPMLCDETTQQDISDKLGIKQRTVSDDIKKIRSILQPLMADIFD